MKKAPEDTIITIKVIPKASFNQIVGWENGMLKIRLTAAPEKGKANQELIDFLSKKLKIPKSKISIIHGEAARMKKVLIRDLKNKRSLHQLFSSLLPPSSHHPDED
jgi:uncharacterized protein (TIGR00251 family)